MTAPAAAPGTVGGTAADPTAADPTGVVVTGLGVACPATDDPAMLLDDAVAGASQDEPWFDVRSRLGRGYKYLPPACHYLLAATRNAIADSGDAFDRTTETGRGLVVGTNSAAAALHQAMDRTVVTTGADDLSPALAPFFSINLFAGRLSMEHAIKGFNLTLNTPRVAGLEAVQAGTRAVAAGRAGLLIVGATEAAGADPGFGRPESGAVVLIMQPSAGGVRCYGSCTVATMFIPPRSLDSRPGTEQAVAEAGARLAGILDRATGTPRCHLFADDSPVAAATAVALRRASGDPPRRVAAGAGCLAPLLRVAGLLANGAGSHLVAVATAEGHVGFALVTCSTGSGGDR